jgi:crotonobetainyl-CoA:carnitine CoA-transferase CaiB-like acyl-CoA transferase
VVAPEDAAQRAALRRVAGERPAEWTRTRPPREVMETLQAAGVPAGMMMRPADHERDPHLCARGIHRDIEQPGLGRVRLEDGPFRSRTMPPVRVGPAPQHGEHTREICATLLGLSEPEIAALLARGVLEVPETTEALAA